MPTTGSCYLLLASLLIFEVSVAVKIRHMARWVMTVLEIRILLGLYAEYNGSSVPDIGTELPFYAAYNTKRVQVPFTSW